VTTHPILLRITRLLVGRRASGFVLVAQCLPIRPQSQRDSIFNHRARGASEWRSGSIGFTISEFAQEIPRDLMNGLRENYSRGRKGARKDEMLVNFDLICAADPGSNLAGRQGFEPRYRGPEAAEETSVMSGFIGFVRKIACDVCAVPGGDGTFAVQGFKNFSSVDEIQSRKVAPGWLSMAENLARIRAISGLVISHRKRRCCERSNTSASKLEWWQPQTSSLPIMSHSTDFGLICTII
jgi:hypothetical protein